MNEPAAKITPSRTVLAILLVLGLSGAALFAAGPRAYPELHTVLDTGMFLLSGILALLLWDLGIRIDRPFPRNLAACFATTSLLNLLHVLASVEWSGPLAPVARLTTVLRPGTWPPAVHVLPLGILGSVWLLRRNRAWSWWFAAGLILLSGALLALFNWLPHYTPPGWLGFTRPALMLSPPLWALTTWFCWQQRRANRLLPMLALMSAVLAVANGVMLYSRSHDAQAMVAHLFHMGGYLVLLVSVMQMAAQNVRERIQAEQALAQLNHGLEQRIRDRTERLEAANRSLETEMEGRRQVEQTNTRLAAIVESSDDAIISKTLEGIITSWNRGAEKIFGYSATECIGQSMLILFPPARVSEEADLLAKIRRGENIVHFETVRITKAGKPIDVSVTLSPIHDHQGKIVGASKIARDITERKVADMKMQAQLGRLNLLHHITRAIGERQDLQSILNVVLQSVEENLPVDFCCVGAYDEPANLLKVLCVGHQSEATATSLAMGPQATIPIDENGLSRCVRGHLVYEPDLSGATFPFPQRLARGGLRSLVIAPLLVESQVFGVLVAARRQPQSFTSGECEFLRQLSEHVALAAHQVQLYGALQQAYDDLRQTQQAVMQQERLRALGQMASGIAHDLNNAISPVTLYTESLLETEPALSARGREYLETIRRATEDVAQTVARLREFYRQREPQLVLTPVNLNQLAQQVLDLSRARWNDMPQQQGIVINITLDLAPNLPVIMGVESEIREALINLIFNGVDAMPDGGTLKLRTATAEKASVDPDSPASRHVQIEVTDTGGGMDEDTRRRCLEPFFTTKGERGTGLGLAMVYGMVQRHSADLEIESSIGKGTTVRLSFAAPAAALVDTVGAAPKRQIPSRLRILVVDDDPLLIKSLRDTLETDGHQVVTANGGMAGIDTFLESRRHPDPFNVVITDLGMPHVDGRQVATAIKAASPATPIILLTGWGQRLVAEGDIPSHVDRVLGKPPKLRELRAALAEVTAGPNAGKLVP